MELTIFSKRRKSNSGKAFTTYLTTLPKKDGTNQSMQVRFRESCGAPRPEDCPMVISVDKNHANISTRDYVREDNGETGKAFTLWVSAWERTDKQFVDTSLDEYDV